MNMILLKQLRTLYGYLILICILDKIEAVIHSGLANAIQDHSRDNKDNKQSIHTVSLTQKGYIQFLRYTNKVPTLTEYTFCIWVNSKNFTHNHPLFSYSRHGDERLIRAWITPFGTHINLEILEVPIFSVPVNFKENRWYHVCQSWSSLQAVFHLFIDGGLWSSGFAPKMKGIPIKGGGDIIIGQEYTDFDKGLDDGIEGDIFGFNFVLSAVTNIPTSYSSNNLHVKQLTDNNLKRIQHFQDDTSYIPSNTKLNEDTSYITPPQTNEDVYNFALPKNIYFSPKNLSEDDTIPHVLSYFNSKLNREPKSIFESKLLHSLFNIFDDDEIPRQPAKIQRRIGPSYHKPYPHHVTPYDVKGYLSKPFDKPLGSLLVELSLLCGYKHGAPLWGKGVLINWSNTPVRVFGGAIVKDVEPFC